MRRENSFAVKSFKPANKHKKPFEYNEDCVIHNYKIKADLFRKKKQPSAL